jgi:transposase
MNKGIRKNYPPGFKSKVALAAITGDKTIAELSSTFGVHTTLISTWKKHLQETIDGAFTNRSSSLKKQSAINDENIKLIGKLTIENNDYKKKLGI